MKFGIVGTGIVGSAWAKIFTQHNSCEGVWIYDVDTEKAKAFADKLGIDLVYLADDLSDICRCDYIQECVPEVLDIKRKLYEQLDSTNMSKIPIFASSSSNIPSSHFTKNLSIQSHCLVAHPINPPDLISLVEIVPNRETKKEVIATTNQILIDLKMKPVILKKEVPGFALNRIQYQVLAECFRMVQDGVLSPEDVDTVVVEGLSPRWSFMGPIQTIDLNAPGGIQDYCSRYMDSICEITNVPKFSTDLVNELTEHQRGKYEVEDIPDVIKWRDNELAKFKQFKQFKDTKN